MSAEENAPTASEYIVHHLTHWQNKPQVDIVDFSVFNIDSIFFLTLIGVVGSLLLWKAARHATAGVPGRFQAAVEILLEMVDGQAKAIVQSFPLINILSAHFHKSFGSFFVKLRFEMDPIVFVCD